MSTYKNVHDIVQNNTNLTHIGDSKTKAYPKICFKCLNLFHVIIGVWQGVVCLIIIILQFYCVLFYQLSYNTLSDLGGCKCLLWVCMRAWMLTHVCMLYVITITTTRMFPRINGPCIHCEHIAHMKNVGHRHRRLSKLDEPGFIICLTLLELQRIDGSATDPSSVCVHNISVPALQS